MCNYSIILSRGDIMNEEIYLKVKEQRPEIAHLVNNGLNLL